MGVAQVSVSAADRLSAAEIAAVGELVSQATAADGVAPLSEHVLLHLAHGGDKLARNLLAHLDGTLVGYAHLDVTNPVSGPSAELVVAPQRRRSGIGTRLVAALGERAHEETADPRLRLWSHGERPAAAAMAARQGFTRTRALWQMRRSLYAPLPRPDYADGVEVATFRVGVDEDAWVAVNRRAFAALPDQGGWQRRDLEVRERESWFDPAGFFLAWRGSELVGFHWTKVHGSSGGPEGHDHPRVGEVYVLGIDPDAGGLGLGRALTLTGLIHLRTAGLPSAMLYVDESNTRAIGLYESLGFIRWDTDVTYQRGSAAP